MEVELMSLISQERTNQSLNQYANMQRDLHPSGRTYLPNASGLCRLQRSGTDDVTNDVPHRLLTHQRRCQFYQSPLEGAHAAVYRM